MKPIGEMRDLAENGKFRSASDWSAYNGAVEICERLELMLIQGANTNSKLDELIAQNVTIIEQLTEIADD